MAHIFRTKEKKTGKYHPKWRFQYTDWQGKRKTATGTTSKTETRKLAELLQSHHEEIRRGFRPPPKISDKHASDPVSDIIDTYLAWGEKCGGRRGYPWGKTHLRAREARLKWWLKELQVETMQELDGILPQVEVAQQDLLDKGLAGKTVMNYREAIHAFCAWCADKRRGYLACNPLDGLSHDFDTTPRTRRRAMTPEEIRAVLRACAPHRRMLYEVAFCSGLRANELRSLTTTHLDVDQCGLHLDPEWTKGRRREFQPLPRDLVGRLHTFSQSDEVRWLYTKFYVRRDAKNRAPANALLYVPSHPARDLGNDLAKAGVPKWSGGGKIDFHACRVAYTTFVLESGATVKEAQDLARHSTPELTMTVYARSREHRLADLAEAVGNVVLAEQRRTGTERACDDAASA